VEKSKKFTHLLQRVAVFLGSTYFDTSEVVVPSELDSYHLDLSEHEKLSLVMANIELDLIGRRGG
jgi:hypothetical protein